MLQSPKQRPQQKRPTLHPGITSQPGPRKRAAIGANMTKPIIGQKVQMHVFGKLQTVTILAVHPFGTLDIETASGACYRITFERL